MSDNTHWKHTDNDGLQLLTAHNGLAGPAGAAGTTVPDDVAVILLHGPPLGQRPGHDLLAAEGRLRQQVWARQARSDNAQVEIHATRARLQQLDLAAGSRRFTSRGHRRERTALQHLLATQIAEHTRAVDELRELQRGIDAIREFVIAFTEQTPADGLLIEAAAGWQRSPDVPPWVSVFDDEASFIAVDERRAVQGGWGGPILEAEMFGTNWRRDGDDTDPHAPPALRSGPWQLGYLPRLGEVYALRRCTHLPEQLWLLATVPSHTSNGTAGAVSDPAPADWPEGVRRHLAELTPRMAEPNSLILAATTVHLLTSTAPAQGGPI
jgi:hypothetical protein